MQRLLIPALACLVAACARSPVYDYTAASKAVLINAVAPEAYYYSFGQYSYDQSAYPVDWEVPQIIEAAVKEASPVTFIDYSAPDWMVGIDMSGFETRLRADEPSKVKTTALGICRETGADVIVVLGTVAVNWSEGGTPRVAQGYGLMTRSGTARRRFWAYSVPAATTINCKPLDYATTAVAYRLPVEMVGFRPSLAVDRLTDEQRAQVKSAVLASLQQGQSGERAPIETIAQAVAAQFDPTAEPVANVQPQQQRVTQEEKGGVW